MKRAFAYFGWAFITAWLLLTALFAVALDDALYDTIQHLAGVDEKVCRLTDEERQTINRDTAMYLASRTEDIPSLSERGQAHMQDVRRLFDAAKLVMYACLAAGIVFLLLAYFKHSENIRRAYFTVLIVFAALCISAALIALFNFDAVFDAFHRLLFSNDLWMLDPEDDVIIRILPEAFFAYSALIIALRAILRLLLAGLATKLIKGAIRRLNT